jgi:DNA invertase Pin-like site-specific DNA recombinase
MKPLGAVMAVVGYARVSSVGQSLDVQLDKLKDCDKVFQEKHTGTPASADLEKKALLNFALAIAY